MGIDEQPINETLKELLTHHLERNPQLTVSALENEDVKRTTISKVLNGATQSLSNASIIGIMKSTHKGKSLVEISKIYEDHPVLGPILKKLSEKTSLHSNLTMASEKIEKCLQDPKAFQIFLLCNKDTGETVENIAKYFGTQGQIAVKRLLEDNVLTQEGNIIRTVATEELSIGIETTKRLLLNFISNSYDLREFANGVNWLGASCLQGNQDYVSPRIREIYRKAHRDIKDLFKHEDAQGTDLIWFGSASDNLIKDEVLDNGTQFTEVIQ